MRDDDQPGAQMSERERQFAELVAQHMMSRVLSAAQDQEVAGRVIDTWAGHLQRVVGRAVLRLLFYVFVAAVGVLSLKFGLWDKLGELFSHKP